ncbi:Na+/H+ antiporter NhaA [Marinobacterium sedimentorum]|uniref:Na+/H+ antiporter NhaA n=1 Tax=Marinobacterium sedimentorum TaxID=2927804 RepID=UPI0020C6DEBC|nr:Na+/H+ antiporter NhaA [Marinobacterium sedimentorum]MCP8688449.1 Na+/H+ antiporter NhaA [Marinobacterium sedimentorum]
MSDLVCAAAHGAAGTIGFTMALFIGGLAFAGTHFEREAQLAILIGSLLAAAVGIAIVLTLKATQTPVPQ